VLEVINKRLRARRTPFPRDEKVRFAEEAVEEGREMVLCVFEMRPHVSKGGESPICGGGRVDGNGAVSPSGPGGIRESEGQRYHVSEKLSKGEKGPVCGGGMPLFVSMLKSATRDIESAQWLVLAMTSI